MNLNENSNFYNLCKNTKISNKIIINNFKLNKKINLFYTLHNKTSIEHIMERFLNSNKKNIVNNISLIEYFLKYIHRKNILFIIDDINKKVQLFLDDKIIVSSLKALIISCNKALDIKYLNKNLKIFIKYIYISKNIHKILKYSTKIIHFIDNLSYIDLQDVQKRLEDVILKKDIIKDNNIILLLNLINKCKKKIHEPSNEIEKILLKINKHIYSFIYFLKNNNQLITNKDNTLSFIKNIGFQPKDFQEIDVLNLKRGFIYGLEKNNKNYILKYQPNKSVMELIINTYLKNDSKNYFLIPLYFFINFDNSYFYIIEKYHSDLNNYFNILEKNDKLFEIKNIFMIAKFLLESAKYLHSNNIIHSDLKPGNIVLNIDNEHNISDIRIIDFDVSLFDKIPESIEIIQDKYYKILNNKKLRGTDLYMLQSKEMSFKNDIYSIGVILLILLYKSIKLIISSFKKNPDYYNQNKIKINTTLKKIIFLKNNLENNTNKKKLLSILIDFYSEINKDKIPTFLYIKEIILDCLTTKYNIFELINKYNNFSSFA
jgi:serine/threonine protein kinase